MRCYKACLNTKFCQVNLILPFKILKSQGMCSGCACCGKLGENQDCCDCWITCAQLCNCDIPDLRSCCDSICGPRQVIITPYSRIIFLTVFSIIYNIMFLVFC